MRVPKTESLNKPVFLTERRLRNSEDTNVIKAFSMADISKLKADLFIHVKLP